MYKLRGKIVDKKTETIENKKGGDTLMVKNIHLEDNINYTVTENLPFS
jgi:hypothetical protein